MLWSGEAPGSQGHRGECSGCLMLSFMGIRGGRSEGRKDSSKLSFLEGTFLIFPCPPAHLCACDISLCYPSVPGHLCFLSASQCLGPGGALIRLSGWRSPHPRPCLPSGLHSRPNLPALSQPPTPTQAWPGKESKPQVTRLVLGIVGLTLSPGLSVQPLLLWGQNGDLAPSSLARVVGT